MALPAASNRLNRTQNYDEMPLVLGMFDFKELVSVLWGWNVLWKLHMSSRQSCAIMLAEQPFGVLN